MLDVKWGNRLERLAEAMFADLHGASSVADSPAAVFARRDAIVVPNRLVQHWLLHRFLYRPDDSPVPRILADVEFPLLNVFVNDWLGRMDQPGAGARDPAAHPFSVPAMRWRIFAALRSGELDRDTFAPVLAYIRPDGAGEPEARAFRLAGRLAAMYDEYMVYRPDMLRDWEAGRDGRLQDSAFAWQPALWRQLTAGPRRHESYLAAFYRMSRDLASSGIQETYRAVHVFGVSMMPPVYVYVLDLLGALLPVRVYTLNPCRRDWFDERRQRDSLLEGRLDTAELFCAGNAFLSDQGRGSRDFLVDLLDRTQGQAEAGSVFETPAAATVLARVQRDLLDGESVDGAADGVADAGADGTIQVHVCHNPMREMEVLRDYLLRRFADDGPLQPREIQVQVTDMATYAPYIDAVFAGTGGAAELPIPYAVADRVAGGESRVAEAFRRLLELATSRFSAPDVLDLLYVEPVREAFGFAAEDVGMLASWVEKAGIRWGHDPQHRREVLAVDFDPPAATTWQYGLDRLLLGFAAGADGEAAVPVDAPLPCDCTGSDGAVALGRLAHFYERLRQMADWMRGVHRAADWADRLDHWINTCFASTDETYCEINELRHAVDALRKSASAAAFGDKIGADVVRAFLAAQVKSASGGGDLVRDAVVFSALRPGSSVPRRVMCLVGMGDGLYPRRDNRPHYDLLRSERRMGDRSPRIEDRMAFLEAVSSARDHLFVSYTGFSAEDGRELPPSVLVEELCEHAGSVFGGADPVRHVRHRLQAFHPAYFQDGSGLFSYSQGDALAAKMYAGNTGQEGLAMGAPPASVNTGPVPDGRTCGEPPAGVQVPRDAGAPVSSLKILELEDLLRFIRNPAAYYYRNVLKVDLEVLPEALPPDSEEFDPVSLAGYQVNQSLAAGLLEEPPMETTRLRRQMEADGLLPLAHAGEAWLARRLQAMQELLAEEIDGLGTVRDAWRHQSAAVAVPATVRVGGVVIEGACVTFALPGSGRPLALDVRWGVARGEDRFAAWVRHVFTCAAGIAETRTFFGARPGKDEKPVLVRFPPLERAEATALLLPIVEAFLDGQRRVLPFTPATAYAYASAYRREKQDGQRHEAGLKRAISEWNGEFGDGRNVYYRKAFGADGPFDSPAGFAALAARLAGPICDAADV